MDKAQTAESSTIRICGEVYAMLVAPMDGTRILLFHHTRHYSAAVGDYVRTGKKWTDVYWCKERMRWRAWTGNKRLNSTHLIYEHDAISWMAMPSERNSDA
ncbi:hypothetical protein [Parvimonas micra]|uniref:hypothetical protein n=1 Tax=Parvimonas micra TaxID=33033 RepID=UPI002B483C57|nr:hypothetical protein [Parvimonas micra]